MEENKREISIELRPVTVKRASEEIFNQIREMITSGQLKPGDRLPSERVMINQLQRSRPTIREALRMLEQGGYISSVHGASGAIVRKLSVHGVEQPLAEMIKTNQIGLEELNEYREMNDGTIAEWAAKRRSEEDVEQLWECMHQAELSLDDADKFIALDVKFHSLLAVASRNQLAMIVTQVLGNAEKEALHKKMMLLSQSERQALCTRILEKHQEIFVTIERQDAEAAKEAMKAHTRAASKDLTI